MFSGKLLRGTRARLGTPKAITATAHKLARIVYHLVTACQEFEATVFESLVLTRRFLPAR